MTNTKIAIIGVGNMGKAIALGLMRKKALIGNNLILSNPTLAKIQGMKKFGAKLTNSNRKAVKSSDIILLAVKPQMFVSVLAEIKDVVSRSQLIISIAAGVEVKTIRKFLGSKQPIVRVMPNLCATVGESVSCWIKTKEVTDEQEEKVRKILRAIGSGMLLDKESLLDQVTAVSGSGPAYVFYLVELLEKSAIKIGLDNKIAKKLARQTILSSAQLIKNSKKSAKILREQVTSKGGTTEAAFKVFERSKFEEIFSEAIKAAYQRAEELHL